VKLAHAAALSIALAAASPARAQTVAAPGFWASTVATAGQMLDIVTWPIRATWKVVTNAAFGAGHAVAEHVQQFHDTLRSDIARFEQVVGRAGFRIEAVNLRPNLLAEIETLGLISPFELVLAPTGRISEEDAARLRAEIETIHGIGGPLERAILLSLLNLHERADRVRPEGYRLSEVSVSLVAFLPELNLTFSRGE
jgi:hypothetical protein